MKRKDRARRAMALLRAHLYNQREQQALAYEPGPLPENPQIRDLVVYCEQRRMLFDIHIPDDTPLISLICDEPALVLSELTIGHIRAATPAEYVDWRK